MMNIVLGADPEFFLWDKNKKQYVSSHNIVPGSKRDPFKLPSGGGVQVDGTAVEFNIPPSRTPDEFARNVRASLRDIRAMVPKNLQFRYRPAVEYKPKYFEALPNESKELGCDPDFNAYTSKRNDPPAPVGTLRTGAGHIHIGWGNDLDITSRSHIWDCELIVKELDKWFLGYEKLWDKDDTRRKMYGARGAYRPKKYGVEYRVLSNRWLRYPKLYPWIFESVQFVVNKVSDGTTISEGVARDVSRAKTIRDKNRIIDNYLHDAPLLDHTLEFEG